jgi:hypothetical protein
MARTGGDGDDRRLTDWRPTPRTSPTAWLWLAIELSGAARRGALVEDVGFGETTNCSPRLPTRSASP